MLEVEAHYLFYMGAAAGRTFLSIVDHGGVTAAAGAIYGSQPSLSHSIKSLG